MSDLDLLKTFEGNFKSNGYTLPPMIEVDGELEFFASEYFPPNGVMLDFQVITQGTPRLKVTVSATDWPAGSQLGATEFQVVSGQSAVQSGFMEQNDLRFRETLYIGQSGVMNHLVEIWKKDGEGNWAEPPSYGFWICPPNQGE